MAAVNSSSGTSSANGAAPFLAGLLGDLSLSPTDLLKDASWARIAATGALVTASAAVLYRKKLVLWLCDYLASSRPNPGEDYLRGIYGPVHTEVHSTELEVVDGKVPEGLEGAFVRTGPNPMFKPTGSYHIFDGDGMMHTVKLGGGRALSYSNRWVETARLKQEKAAGRPLFAKIGDMWGATGLALVLLEKVKERLGVVDKSQGRGTANTALVFHAKRLLALNEGDLPYQLRILCNGVLETVGRIAVAGGDGEGQPYPGPFSAHPKVDPRNGELFYFGYSLEQRPYVRGGMMDAKGTVTKQWAVDAPYPAMMHDCGLTEHYALLLQLPLTFLPKKMVKENTLPLGFDASLPSRIGLLRRDAPGLDPATSVLNPAAPHAPVTWVDIPNSFIFHVANCWEDEQGLVHLVACRYDKFNFHGFTPGSKEPYPQDERPKLTDIVLDPASGKMVSLTTLSPLDVDFPMVHPELATRRTRYVWGATMDFDGQLPLFIGIAKFDLSLPAGPQQDACVGHIVYPPGVIGGEAVFVPRANQASEDDGWLLVYVTQADGISEMHVYDARTMAQQPLARVRMPQRVPFGFHGTFVRKDQLDVHRTTL